MSETEIDSVEQCPFCTLSLSRIVDADDHAMAIRDGFPMSPGHTLILPRRHVQSYFDVTDAERDSLIALLEKAQQAIQDEMKPDGWNIGINDGAAAGQTVPHLHMHLIPRYAGDVPDPRGGIRWVLPAKADYWSGNCGD